MLSDFYFSSFYSVTVSSQDEGVWDYSAPIKNQAYTFYEILKLIQLLLYLNLQQFFTYLYYSNKQIILRLKAQRSLDNIPNTVQSYVSNYMAFPIRFQRNLHPRARVHTRTHTHSNYDIVMSNHYRTVGALFNASQIVSSLSKRNCTFKENIFRPLLLLA